MRTSTSGRTRSSQLVWSGGSFVLLGALGTANLAAWLWAVLAFHGAPKLMAIGLVAYGLGLRHAVDADHIAAIDNVTRKLREDGQRPQAVGFFFSLGHSTVVLLATLAMVGGTITLRARVQALRDTLDVAGTLVSACFLIAIALFNLAALIGVWRRLRADAGRSELGRAQESGCSGPCFG